MKTLSAVAGVVLAGALGVVFWNKQKKRPNPAHSSPMPPMPLANPQTANTQRQDAIADHHGVNTQVDAPVVFDHRRDDSETMGTVFVDPNHTTGNLGITPGSL
ncbi:hypothetical protein [Rufibacter hautae]|uniref:Uncharacterized protein n=1 Tax=Rufibacter hautae TaxID=2595005 RepID=A0A5B6TBR8_9BACT|nr:hypothetical protein [Rufibacter hautae]KAA3437618.1 hypothetical protein FOA19_09910 [Rufibacter hautae]